jgi:hypothetical protein
LRRQSLSHCRLPNIVCALRFVGYSNDVFSPAFFPMLSKIACRFGVTFVQESSHGTFPALAGFGNATKGVATTPINVLDLRDRLKKGIDR